MWWLTLGLPLVVNLNTKGNEDAARVQTILPITNVVCECQNRRPGRDLWIKPLKPAALLSCRVYTKGGWRRGSG